MNKNNFIKTSAAIFILLGVIISLFPPFEFELNRNLGDFRQEIRNKFPLKQYDLLFGSEKKYLLLDYDTCYVKFYNKETLDYYKKLWNYCDFSNYNSSLDTFYVQIKFLFKRPFPIQDGSPKLLDMNTPPDTYKKMSTDKNVKLLDLNKPPDNYRASLDQQNPAVSPAYKPPEDNKIYYGGQIDPSTAKPVKPWEMDWDPPFINDLPEDAGRNENFPVQPQNITFYPKYISINDMENMCSSDYNTESAINYNEVKNEYTKNPNDWDFKDTTVIRTIKKYEAFKIIYPISPLVIRKLLFGELMVEYILAFLVSIIVGYLISKLKIPV